MCAFGVMRTVIINPLASARNQHSAPSASADKTRPRKAISESLEKKWKQVEKEKNNKNKIP